MEDQQSTGDYDPESGLSLKDAIRQFSDPDLWFEYQTFSAPTTSLRVLISARAQALLKNESPKSRAIRNFKPESVPVNCTRTKYADLRSVACKG